MPDEPQFNILVLFNDDHGQWALPTYGNSELHTPNIDFLANQGVVFENAFTPIPVCSPARASFFTGLLPSQHGIHDYIAAADEFHSVDWLSKYNSLPSLLQTAGYRCGLSGKWHLGRDEDVQAGFSDWFALSGDFPIEHKGSYRYSDQGELVTLSGYKTQYIAERTIAFLRQHDPARPFFHFTSFYATHSPWSGHPERLVEQYRHCTFSDIPPAEKVYPGQLNNVEHENVSQAGDHEARAQYYASISTIDEAVGRILDELDCMIPDRPTLIVYTSDHGLCLGHHGIWGKGNATAPQNFIEESIRVPMILSAKGILPEAVRRKEFADHLDIFQTILAAAGIERPDGNYAGENLINLFSDPAAPWRDAQYCEYGPARMIRTEHYKYIHRHNNQEAELYDLLGSGGETNNLYYKEGYDSIAKNLEQKLHDYFTRHECVPPNEINFNGPPRFNNTEAWRQVRN